jgi:hypothetical protein
MPDDEREPADAPAEQPPDVQPPDAMSEEPEEATPSQAPSDAEAWVVPPPPAPPSPDAIPAHAVPATPLGEGTRCPRCGTDNRPGIAFCRSCGQRLMAPGAPATVERPAPPEGSRACPRCGTHNRAGVAFCQNCGANLRPADPGVLEARAAREASSGRAILGPVVLLIGAAGLLTAWLLPFDFGGASLWDRSFGAPGGYGIAFWRGYPNGPLTDATYFGLAAPVPVLLLILVGLAAAGFMRAAPGAIQRVALAISLAWGLGLALLFLLVELFGEPGRDLVQVLRTLSPGGIIFLLAGLIVVIGSLTRLWRA